MTKTQEQFERLRLLVIKYGSKEDVDALHYLRERFNELASNAHGTVRSEPYDWQKDPTKNAGNGY